MSKHWATVPSMRPDPVSHELACIDGSWIGTLAALMKLSALVAGAQVSLRKGWWFQVFCSRIGKGSYPVTWHHFIYMFIAPACFLKIAGALVAKTAMGIFHVSSSENVSSNRLQRVHLFGPTAPMIDFHLPTSVCFSISRQMACFGHAS